MIDFIFDENFFYFLGVYMGKVLFDFCMMEEDRLEKILDMKKMPYQEWYEKWCSCKDHDFLKLSYDEFLKKYSHRPKLVNLPEEQSRSFQIKKTAV